MGRAYKKHDSSCKDSGKLPKTKNCRLCGGKMVWEHREMPGHYIESSCNIEDWPICHDCMAEHCCLANCLDCNYGKYPDCRFMELKQHYMSKD